MAHISISSLPRPSLRRLLCVVIVILVLWITPRITNLILQSQQEQLEYNSDETGRLYPPKFNYSNSKLCPGNGENVKLLILITSPPSITHLEKRRRIRDTWRHLTISSDGRQDIVIGFMMGREEKQKKSDNFTIQQEIDIFDDIIIGNFVDSYDNQTLKTLSILEWAMTYCSQAKYLLKTDDDIWINIPNILNFTEFLENMNSDKLAIYGSLRSGKPPHRHVKSKCFVSCDHYLQKQYPHFVAGAAYLLPRTIWQNLYLDGLQGKFFKLEDVYFTGIVASRLGIQRIHVTNFLLSLEKNLHWNDTELNAEVATTFAVSLGNISDMTHIWNAYNSSGCYDNYRGGNNCKAELFANALFQAQNQDKLLEKENSITVFSASVLAYIGMFTLTVFSLVLVYYHYFSSRTYQGHLSVIPKSLCNFSG